MMIDILKFLLLFSAVLCGVLWIGKLYGDDNGRHAAWDFGYSRGNTMSLQQHKERCRLCRYPFGCYYCCFKNFVSLRLETASVLRLFLSERTLFA